MTTQLDKSIGFSPAEASYGTNTTVTKFFEFTDESFGWDATYPQGQGARVGSRFPRAARRPKTPVKQQVTGDMTVEVGSKSIGFFFNAAMGAVTSTQRATTGVYQHNFTPAASDYLSSYSCQVGIPPLGGGAALAQTFTGMVCSGFELDCPNADLVSLKSTWNGRDVTTATAYAAPSYPTPIELLTFAGGSVTIGGSPSAPTTTALATGGTAASNIRDFTVVYDNGIDDGGFNFGGAGKRGRKPAIGMSSVTGSLTAEFDSATLRDAYLNQTDLAVVLTFVGSSTIGSGSDVPALSVYLPDLRLDGELPKGGANDVAVTQSINFTSFDNLSASAITVSYVSLDTAP